MEYNALIFGIKRTASGDAQRSQMSENKRWMRTRHRVLKKLASIVLKPIAKWKYGAAVDPFVQQGKRPYLVLYNHQTPFDQFFVGISFQGPVYYLATEDIFSKGLFSSILRYTVAPIPIIKQTTDLVAIKNCVHIAREGGTLAIAPEGNRTYSGKTEHMSPAICPLAKLMKLPIALYRIEGGFGVQPRWSDGIRKGKMHAYVSRVIEPEEYAKMDDDALFAAIESGLKVNEGCADGLFESPRRAEYLERAVYVCPYCGLSTFESRGNVIECKSCHRQIEYGADKRLRGVGFDFPFSFVTEWMDAQRDFVCSLDVTKHTAEPLFRDAANLYEVIVYKKKQLLRKATPVCLYGDQVVVGEGNGSMSFPFSQVSGAAVLGRNKLNLYHGDKIYQFKGGKRFNALKYVNLYYRYQYIRGGNGDGKFLGY